ncbi:uncharacterized protein LOC131238024 [Magnolia sinica]|uniref:uncharacterized protein LOC131238024 n=1 Tax=Magnolia sinica TaxID=86752 RepID=UPI00265A67FB|nr:uncharacterized protein LOC131238024 [Magnolia sinica]
MDRRKRGRLPNEGTTDSEKPWKTEIQNLQRQIADLKQNCPTSQAGLEETKSSFVDKIMHARLPDQFRLPQIIPYTGKADPTEHIESFWIHMELHDASDAVMCRAFLLTLSDVARLWFKQLKPRSISSFAELNDTFIANFIGGKKRLKVSMHLNNIVQKEEELLKDYIKRFNLEALQVWKHSNETAINSIMQGVRDKLFLLSLDKNPPSTLAEFMARVEKYTNVEETRILREVAQNRNAYAKQSTKKDVDLANTNKKRKDDRPRDEHRSSKRPDSKIINYTPLNKPQEQVLMEIKGENFVNWANKLRSNPDR